MTKNEALDFLQQLRPGGPWVLTAITPDGPTKTITARDANAVQAFVQANDGKRNLYYSVNPTRAALTSKAAKKDIAAIEYLLADLDPNNDETSEVAKSRYRKALEANNAGPTAIVDSGNGIQGLWKLSERIVLPDPTTTQWAETVADVEGRMKSLMERLGAKAGTQNIDRILRLPGTTNLPNKKKMKAGRVACPAKLILFNGIGCDFDDFPIVATVESGDDVDSLPISKRMKDLIHGVDDPKHHYNSRSEQVWAVLLAMTEAGCSDAQISTVLLDSKHPISAHVLEQDKPPTYLARQITKARATIEKARHYDPGNDGPRPMGYTRNAQFALLVRNSIILANSTQLVSPSFLIGLAPTTFWKRQFPPATNKQTFGAFAAGETLIQACNARGAYDPTRTRGQGVWREGSRIIVNFGGPLPDHTEHTYLCFNKIEVRQVEAFEAQRLLDLLRIWPWKQPSYAVLYLGWLAYAPVCGAVDWRPHIYPTGEPGSGKSALHKLAARLLQQTALLASGTSSAAGTRQALGPDSRPVLIDDIDDNKELPQIVHLTRMASSSDDPTLRGTPEGKALRFMPVATFHLTSVSQLPMLQQDVERIVQLELTKHASDREVGERLKHELQHFEDRGKDWFGYCVGNIALLQPSIDMFNLALPIENQRHRLTLATLLGAAFVALHHRVPSEQEANGWATEHAAATEAHVLATSDRDSAMEALNHLLYHRPFGEKRTLGHHIAMAGLVVTNPMLSEPITKDDDNKTKWLKLESRRSRTVLFNHSIMVKRNKDDDRRYEVFLMNEAPAINKLYEKSPWEGGWKGMLARVPNAAALKNAVHFIGHNKTARGVVVPGELIPEPELGEAHDDGDGPEF